MKPSDYSKEAWESELHKLLADPEKHQDENWESNWREVGHACEMYSSAMTPFEVFMAWDELEPWISVKVLRDLIHVCDCVDTSKLDSDTLAKHRENRRELQEELNEIEALLTEEAD